MMLLPYNKEPATGSRIPSISTGGAAMKPMMKQDVAVNNVGNIIQPNQPMYKRFSVLVIQPAKRSHKETLERLSKVAVIKNFCNCNSSQVINLLNIIIKQNDLFYQSFIL
jgi:hypothetical protein